ncbi:type 4a pilus biogenesis protein PilO [Alteromonas sp. LMIT006]|uniref:type 4a pilus biogenesis protein PilO n=1 Tax=Alteromonadaceae TaxID=72275 RepID=UPI0020CA810C|nr:type 4a pilus biogenesis protein PilO [Alteromonas sp. LMIT006]UTP72941.1 type 4a pilus biogenesis protein PilO [Alteromonas sp. LMIT006]
MNFDFQQLKKLNQLDFDQAHRWSKEMRIVVAFSIAVFVSILASYLLVAPKLPLLEQSQLTETELRTQFLAKQRIASNLPAYQTQFAKLEEDFSQMLKALPTNNETPGLLDDITYVGTTSGLRFQLLQWQPEQRESFYTELPIQLEVTGQYHAFGQFVANIANLPRIVTLHDFTVNFSNNSLKLQMQAQTYRTNDPDETNLDHAGESQ